MISKELPHLHRYAGSIMKYPPFMRIADMTIALVADSQAYESMRSSPGPLSEVEMLVRCLGCLGELR